MRTHILNRLTFLCIVLLGTARYLWLQFDSVKYNDRSPIITLGYGLEDPSIRKKVISSLPTKPECNDGDIYTMKKALLFSEFDANYGDNVLWKENISSFHRENQHILLKTESWIQSIQQNILVESPPWWPVGISFRQFPMFHNETYDEGLWCPAKTFHTEIRVFSCVTVDTGSIHPSVIGGVTTKHHIISHDARVAIPNMGVKVVKVGTLALPGTNYYPEAPGHFPNEIMPKLLSLHEHVPLHVPLLWPDTVLAKMILREMKSVGEFKDRQILFQNPSDGLLHVELAYVYVYADDSAYRNNYAGSSIRELQSVHSLFRRVIMRYPVKNNHNIVFWMRNSGAPRSISNMDEVINELSDFNVKYILHDESLAYFEQASILQSTNVFISPHGAGMNNVLFLHPGATAIEIVYSDPTFRCPEEYYCLCSAIGIDYFMTASEGTSSSQLRVLFPEEIGYVVRQKTVKTDIILGMAQGYSSNDINVFVSSFYTWNPKAHLILFTDSEMEFEGRYSGRLHIISISSVTSDHRSRTLEPVIERFSLYLLWIQSSFKDGRLFGFLPGKIFLTDVRDVFFQGDVFKPINDKGLYFFEEGSSLKNEPFYNQRWIKECKGSSVLQYLIEKNAGIINAGVIGASEISYMVQFLKIMVQTLHDTKCNDQGLLNYLIHFELPGMKIPLNIMRMTENSWVAHALTEYNPEHPLAHPNTHMAPIKDIWIDSIQRIVGPHGMVYAIIHQADRFEALWALRHRIQTPDVNTLNHSWLPVLPLKQIVFEQA